jgi:hypothetical protein
MALTGSGTISMDDMRTEFGISGSISMSDLYRGGSEVSSTANQGGTISISSLTSGSGPFGDSGFSSVFAAYRVAALPVTLVNGDVITSYGGTSYSMQVQHNGQSGSGGPGIAASIYLGNSTGGTQNGTSLASAGLPSNGLASGTMNIGSNTTLSNQGGATHLVYKVNGGGTQNQQDNSEYDVTLGSSSMTITQNRSANDGVPESGTISFSDLYGAAA